MSPSRLSLYLLSLRLGVSHLLTRGYRREALIRVLVPIEPVRCLEFPEVFDSLDARPGERILDVASPKLVAVALATRGAEVVSVDAFPEEVEAWRAIAGDTPGLSFRVGDARRLDYPDATFDHAYSISVLEHIPDDGDLATMGELARVVRPGGRVVITTGLSPTYAEDWRDGPVYGEEAGEDGRVFFARTYDQQRLDRLIDAARPYATLADQRVMVATPTALLTAYERYSPWLLPLAPFLGLVVGGRDSTDGGIVRLTFERH